MKIKVTENHIAQGEKESCSYCPVALAISEVIGLGDEDYIKVTDNVEIGIMVKKEMHHYQFEYPNNVCEFINKFDRGLVVEPFEFDLWIDHLVGQGSHARHLAMLRSRGTAAAEPISYEDNGSSLCSYLKNKDGKRIASIHAPLDGKQNEAINKEYAAFWPKLVTAVNAHDDLVAASRETLEMLEAYIKANNIDEGEVVYCRDALRAALAKVRS